MLRHEHYKQKNISNHAYSLKGTRLQVVTSWPYLGVEIDNKLTWTPHIIKVQKAATRSLGVVQRTLHAAPQACKITAYKALVRPKLEYASNAWSPQSSGKIKRLESVQNKAARFVTRTYDRHTSVTQLKNSLEWDHLAARRNARDCVMWYKIHNGLVYMPFPGVVVPKPRLGRHDHPLAYLQLHSQVNAYLHSYFVRTIPLWNALPATTVSAITLQAFQRQAMANLVGQRLP